MSDNAGHCTYPLERTKRKGLPCGKKDHKDHPGYCRVHYKAMVLKKLQEPPTPADYIEPEKVIYTGNGTLESPFDECLATGQTYTWPDIGTTLKLPEWDESRYKIFLRGALQNVTETSELLKNS